MATKQLRFLCILPTIISIILACPEDTLFVIKPTVNQDLALDISDPSQIKLEEFKASPSQIWRFEAGNRVGLFYIVNNQTGQVLDYRPSDEGFLNLVARKKKNALHQQWAFSMKGRISNAENRRNIDVLRAKFLRGSRVTLFGDNGSPAQDFVVEKFEPEELLEVTTKSQ